MRVSKLSLQTRIRFFGLRFEKRGTRSPAFTSRQTDESFEEISFKNVKYKTFYTFLPTELLEQWSYVPQAQCSRQN